MSATLENLAKAFVGESQARNRYAIYSSIARKEWYLQISDIFLMTAEQEREHAERFFKMLQSIKWDAEKIDVQTTMVSTFGDTLKNLETAIHGENEEYTKLYPAFAQAAQDEGYPEIAGRIRAIMKAEMHHEERYKKLYEQVKNETVYKKDEETEWMCTKCGYIHKGKTPPIKCPSCDHDKTRYVVKCETY